jgi:predicted house-cleaning noncanonical NTP pyrophosphatase (MazG superfamily)/predicted RNase H-like nuclease
MQLNNGEELTQYVLGIDAAWTEKEPSGLAVLKYNKDGKHNLVKVSRSYEEFINGKLDWNVDAVGSYPDMKKLLEVCNDRNFRISVAALDIPLSPMPITGRRTAEALISKEYGKYGAATHSPNADRPGLVSQVIFNQFKESGFNFSYEYQEKPAFIEVYPHVAIIELLNLKKRLAYKVHNRSKYWPDATTQERNSRIISSLNTLRAGLNNHVSNIDAFIPVLKTSVSYRSKTLKEYEDMLDAIVCALVGCFYIDGKVTAYGDETGAIWVPKVLKNNPSVKVFNKLVRDKIPEIIMSNGKSCEIEVADRERRYELLEDKLKEEVDEFLEAKNLEELADVMEVLFALAKSRGYSEEELLKKRDEKREERGAFNNGIVLLTVEE